jgi:hypothetical protein
MPVAEKVEARATVGLAVLGCARRNAAADRDSP